LRRVLPEKIMRENVIIYALAKYRWLFCFMFLIGNATLFAQPRPGDIYREYSRTMGQTNQNWRVTDPNVKDKRAWQFLPNAVLHIKIDDLKGAIRAEALIDRWGAHPGTSNKKIRFNGKPWILLPELKTTPKGVEPEKYVYQDNPIIEIPLSDLKEGDNTFEGTCDDPDMKWPQWGWDGIVIRIYYDVGKPHPMGRIISPHSGDAIGDNPSIQAEVDSEVGVEQVDFLAYYDGYDENGDGVFKEWHRQYWAIRWDSLINIRCHVGTANRSPFQLKWDTKWIPDQKPGAVKIIARIKDRNGIWSVTQPVENLSLVRKGESVRLYKSFDIPASFTIRNGQTKTCKIKIPGNHDFKNATEAIFLIRTWNGWAKYHEHFKINDWSHVLEGHNHNFDYDMIPVPVSALKQGANVVVFSSKTEQHGVEVLWPGPALMIRYKVMSK